MIEEARRGTLTQEKLKQYLDAGADINAKDHWGDTALISAAIYDETAITQQLIVAGADPNIRRENDGNKTARDYAKDKTAYDKAVAAGLAERKAYLDRQTQAKKVVEAGLEQPQQKLSDIANIISEYAYGQSPFDLPESEKKEDAAHK